MGSGARSLSSFCDTFLCLGSALITFSFGTITVSVLTLGVESLRAITAGLWLVPMINSNTTNLVSASSRSKVFSCLLAFALKLHSKVPTSAALEDHDLVEDGGLLVAVLLLCDKYPSHVTKVFSNHTFAQLFV